MTYLNKLTLADGPQIDGFGRLRTSDPKTIHDFKRVDGVPDNNRTTLVAGGGTAVHDTNRSSYALTVATAGDEALIQGKFRSIYQSGKSLLVYLTGRMAAGVANLTQEVGYNDALDGYIVKVSGTLLSIARRSSTSGSAVDVDVPQSSWNLDKLNGSGPSGITIDLTKAFIMVADMEWLGVGRVRVGFVIDGMIVYAHQFLNANNLDVVHIKNPNLIPRWRIKAETGYTGGSRSMEAICASVQSEGGYESVGHPRGCNVGTTGRSINAGNVAECLSVRFQSLLASATHVRPMSMSVVASANSTFVVELHLNAANAAAGTWVAVPGSVLEKNAGRNGAVTDGTIVFTSYVSNDANQIEIPLSELEIGVSAAGVSDILSVVVRNIATNGDFYASLNWAEEM